MKIKRYIKYKPLIPIILDTEDYIKVVAVDDKEIVLSVNGKKILLRGI